MSKERKLSSWVARVVGKTLGLKTQAAPSYGDARHTAAPGETPPSKLRIYQYWDAHVPPDEVLANIATIEKTTPEASLTLFDRKAAEQLIAHHHGAEALAAFRACGPPAMQADYLRLCIMDALGGLYIDADDAAIKDLSTLVDHVNDGLLLTWNSIISNNPLFFRCPKHPFVSACLALSTENIKARRFDSVLMATGPAVLTAIYSAGNEGRERAATDTIAQSPWNMAHWRSLLERARVAKRQAGLAEQTIQRLTIMNVEECTAWMLPQPMMYKKSPRHWINWNGSIYEVAK